mgnify:CR=1 FL=1
MNKLDSTVKEATEGKTPKWLISRATGAVLRSKTQDKLRVRRTIGEILPAIIHSAAARDEETDEKDRPYFIRIFDEGIASKLKNIKHDKVDWARKASRVWRAYDELFASRDKISLNRIAKFTEVDYNCVGRILNILGIGREAVANKRTILYGEHKDAVDRTLRIYGNLAAPDLAYFLRTEKHVIRDHRRNLNAEGQRIASCERVTGLELASRIYECTHEVDFSNGEIGLYVDCSERTVERKIGASGTLIPIILGILRTAYPTRARDVPYLTREDRFE